MVIHYEWEGKKTSLHLSNLLRRLAAVVSRWGWGGGAAVGC